MFGIWLIFLNLSILLFFLVDSRKSRLVTSSPIEKLNLGLQESFSAKNLDSMDGIGASKIYKVNSDRTTPSVCRIARTQNSILVCNIFRFFKFYFRWSDPHRKVT